MSGLDEKALEAAARAMCHRPDECVFGTGSAAGDGSSSFDCYRYAWQDKVAAAHAAITAYLSSLPTSDAGREMSAIRPRLVGEAIIDCSNCVDDTLAIDGERLTLCPDSGIVSIDLRKLSKRLAIHPAPSVAEPAEPVEHWPETHEVADIVARGKGFWKSCCGCHELNEGHPTGPWSAILGCNLGMGCHECGGIGAVWDTTDYADMGDYLSAPSPSEPDSGCTCQGCGRLYRADLIVPDDVWGAIASPKTELLCAYCIMERIAEAGIWTVGRADDGDKSQAYQSDGLEAPVERLRERWETTDAPVAKKVNRLLKLCREAADALTTLRADLEAAKAASDHWASETRRVLKSGQEALDRAETAEAETVERIAKANERVPGIETPLMGGDNLAICLCSFFDDGDRETEDDTGWSQRARDGYEEVITAIREHYAAAIRSSALQNKERADG